MIAHAFFDYHRKFVDLPVSRKKMSSFALSLWAGSFCRNPVAGRVTLSSTKTHLVIFSLEEHRCRQGTGKVQSGISCVGESEEVLRSSSKLSALLEASPFQKLCFPHVYIFNLHKLKYYNQCNDACQKLFFKTAKSSCS